MTLFWLYGFHMFPLRHYGNAILSVMIEPHFRMSTIYKLNNFNTFPLLLFDLYYCIELIVHSIRE